MKNFKYCCVIMRGQPFHNGHYELFKNALAQAETVLILLGSYKKSPDMQNPWSAEEREQMIRLTLTEEELKSVKFIYVRDNWYLNNLWLTNVQALVAEATDNCDDSEICNLGAVNDFPQWKFIYQPNLDNMPHATKIRELYFTHDAAYKQHVHPKVAMWLEGFKSTEKFKYLKAGFDYVMDYREDQRGAKWPITFVTVDSVVIKSGHVLVVRRRGARGKGQIALPGGFLNQDETTQDGALRELKEETAIKVSKEDLESSIKSSRVFDHPKRSLRGRVITHAFLIDLSMGSLPQVRGSDDADKAWWMSLKEFATREEEFFEDHFHIISAFTNRF
jgi:bifunctional NMN adenylyltransferase/nudix hydrolase